MKKVQKKLYARLKKAKAKAIKNKDKVFYVYKYSTRDIKCITNDECRLVTKLDIKYKRSIFRKRNASDNKCYYFVNEELKIEKLQKVFVSIVGTSINSSKTKSKRSYEDKKEEKEKLKALKSIPLTLSFSLVIT